MKFMSHAAIARELNISEARVWQLEKKALQKIRGAYMRTRFRHLKEACPQLSNDELWRKIVSQLYRSNDDG
jgi:transcriptional regulator